MNRVSLPFLLGGLAIFFASALTVVVVAQPFQDDPDADVTRPGEPAPVQANVPELTPDQVALALSISSRDQRVAALLEGHETRQPVVGAWHFSGGTLIGASVSIDLQDAARISGEWLTFDFRGLAALEDDTIPPSLAYTATYDGVDNLSVAITLPEGRVAKIEPHGVTSSLELVGTVPPELADQPTGTPAEGD